MTSFNDQRVIKGIGETTIVKNGRVFVGNDINAVKQFLSMVEVVKKLEKIGGNISIRGETIRVSSGKWEAKVTPEAIVIEGDGSICGVVRELGVPHDVSNIVEEFTSTSKPRNVVWSISYTYSHFAPNVIDTPEHQVFIVREDGGELYLQRGERNTSISLTRIPLDELLNYSFGVQRLISDIYDVIPEKVVRKDTLNTKVNVMKFDGGRGFGVYLGEFSLNVIMSPYEGLPRYFSEAIEELNVGDVNMALGMSYNAKTWEDIPKIQRIIDRVGNLVAYVSIVSDNPHSISFVVRGKGKSADALISRSGDVILVDIENGLPTYGSLVAMKRIYEILTSEPFPLWEKVVKLAMDYDKWRKKIIIDLKKGKAQLETNLDFYKPLMVSNYGHIELTNPVKELATLIELSEDVLPRYIGLDKDYVVSPSTPSYGVRVSGKISTPIKVWRLL